MVSHNDPHEQLENPAAVPGAPPTRLTHTPSVLPLSGAPLLPVLWGAMAF